MAFPPTQLTLICRIANGGSEEDWQQFLQDYWGPICRFALLETKLSWEDAEDVAASTFEVLLRNRLLAKWHSHRSAKLRTLLCAVVRKILANHFRLEKGRAKKRRKLVSAGAFDDLLVSRGALEVPAEQANLFYAAWVEDLLHQCVEALMRKYHRSGNGDYFRVLYGRLCEDMTLLEVGNCLELSCSTVDSYYKTAARHLAQELEDRIRRHVDRYCDTEEVNKEFEEEWSQLGKHLDEQGGLEEAVRQTWLQKPPGTAEAHRSDSFISTAALLRSAARGAKQEPPPF